MLCKRQNYFFEAKKSYYSQITCCILYACEYISVNLCIIACIIFRRSLSLLLIVIDVTQVIFAQYSILCNVSIGRDKIFCTCRHAEEWQLKL